MFCENCKATLGDESLFCSSCGTKVAVKADYNVKLSQFHWRVWQDELGLEGTISEYGHVKFGRQGVGDLTIFIAKAAPTKVTVNYSIIEDYFGIGLTTAETLQICNWVNVFGGARATMWHQGRCVEANLHLFLPAQDTEGIGALPDEGFLRAVIGPAMSEIEDAVKEFTKKLKKGQ